MRRIALGGQRAVLKIAGGGGNNKKRKGSEGCESGPAPHPSEKHHSCSALAAACAPCRQAEQKGAESESGLQRDCCVAMATVFALDR